MKKENDIHACIYVQMRNIKKTYCKNITGTMDGKVQHTHTIHQHIQSLRIFLENNRYL